MPSSDRLDAASQKRLQTGAIKEVEPLNRAKGNPLQMRRTSGFPFCTNFQLPRFASLGHRKRPARMRAISPMSVQLIAVKHFILEAVEIAARLDAVSSRDNREEIVPALQRAKDD